MSMELIRQNGKEALGVHAQRTELTRELQERPWGYEAGIKGFKLSTWQSVASFILATGCHPQQINILGGKVYLNEQFWRERMTVDPSFAGMRQEQVSHAAAAALRALAQERDQRSGDWAQEAKVAWLKHDEMREWIAKYDVPDNANYHGWVTIITRDLGHAVVEFEEYSFVDVDSIPWTPEDASRNKKSRPVDSAGYNHPGKTARTRSLRRCAAKAFPAILSAPEIRAAQESMDRHLAAEAEQAPPPVAPVPDMVQVGAGEPQQVNEIVVDEAARREAQKGYFATVRACGIADAARKAWQQKRGYPESAKDMSQQQFEAATAELTAGLRKRVMAASTPEKVEEVSVRVLGRAEPRYATEWAQVRDALASDLQAQQAALAGPDAGEADDDGGSV